MKRRGFLKKIPIAASAPVVLNGMPVGLLAKGQLQQVVSSTSNDKVLVLIQLHGGNDGLNAVIPIDQYAQYYNLRPNIAIPDNGSRGYIPLDSTLASGDQVGLHPDMVGTKALYDQGKAAIVQGVSYENHNGSHFRSRDIMFMGGDYDDYLGSGWMGRYLDYCFPNYPDAYPTSEMPDPLGLEIGTSVSLAFHRDNGIPAAIAANDPEGFFDLINNTGGLPPESVMDTHYGQELQWIMDIEANSNQYADRLKEVFDNGSNTPGITYPETYPLSASRLSNPLSPQLKLIARMLSGGSKTRIFLARIGGFDTHGNQVESYDPTLGNHAALLYYISSAVEAFQNDLQGLGLEDRVVTATFSEFGRRAASNASYGTDHGNAAPMFVFGKAVKPGIIGTNPDLVNLPGNNIPLQVDYRQVFTTILHDWMEATDEAMVSTLFDGFLDQKLDLFGSVITSTRDEFISKRFKLNSAYPNPVRDYTTFSYYINTPVRVDMELFDTGGRKIRNLIGETQNIGEHRVRVDLTDLPPGTYVYRIKAGPLYTAKKLIKL
jgi:uncharacterized protein (DUF1501 family)